MDEDKKTIIEEFENYLSNKTKLLKSTKKIYVWCIKFYLNNNFNLESIEDYNSVIIDHAIKKRSNVFYSAFKLFIKFHIENKSQKNKMIKALLKPKENAPLRHRKFLNFNERKRIINALNSKKHRIIAKIQFYTGCRIREILQLQKGDIIYDDYNGCECMIINITQKGGQKTPVWILNKELEDEIDMYTLSKWIDWKYYFVERDKCFGDSDETTLIQTNYVWYWKDLKSAVKSCGYDYKDWSTHDFRRCVGGDVWAATKDPLAVQRILRHVRFETTQRYLKNSGLQNKEILSKLNEAYK